jgi:hypothetical protein
MAKKRRWDDDQLRTAVRDSTSYADVLRSLGLAPRGSAHWTVRKRIAELGLDVQHIEKRRWTDGELRAAVVSSRSYVEVLRCLGLDPDAGNHQRLRRAIRQFQIDVSHFARTQQTWNRSPRWTDTQLVGAVRMSTSVAGVLRSLGIIAAGGNYEVVNRHIQRLQLDTSHFTGRGWTRGKGISIRPATPLVEILVGNRAMTSHHLKQRLIAEGVKPAHCELCGWHDELPTGDFRSSSITSTATER